MKKLYFVLLLCCSALNAQIINFPDAMFKSILVESSPNPPNNYTALNLAGDPMAIDANGDSEIDQQEALQVSSLTVWTSGVTDLTGLSYFTNLVYLDISMNNISTIDITVLTHLEYLDCSANYQLTSLNLSSTSLKKLVCMDMSGSSVSSLSLANLPSLEILDCTTSYGLNTIDCTGAPGLKRIECFKTSVSSINISNNLLLEAINFGWSNLTSLDLSGLTQLKNVSCFSNAITTLDLSDASQLISLDCSNNNLTSLFIKNGTNEYVDLSNNPNIEYICTDDSQLLDIQALAPPTCEVNSYCSFGPGGNYYTVHGQTQLDLDNNGCGSGDGFYPQLKFTSTNGSESGIFIANNSGDYLLRLQAGSHTITPVLENDYYTLSTPQFTVDFPSDGNDITQNICVALNGSHNDLELILMPVSSAIAGSYAFYKLVLRNTGNSSQLATITLSFDDDVVDFMYSTPASDIQAAGSITWNNISIAPFETKEISLGTNLNGPTETPPLVSGSILHYTAVVTSAATEETPENNTAQLVQTVVNSTDPNDKTCLEGDSITPDMVGDYLHYMIRFENTGTAPAQNVVVVDMIDPVRFDIASLLPINSNYSYTTRITGNKVEFIFENINLPFDDDNNDGYVLFKIKTRPTLVLGDVIANRASIYFDYNFPVVTNTATTTVELPLGVTPQENQSGFALYPNPAKNTISIASKTNQDITSVIIYNALGQEVMKVLPAKGESNIDVSRLPIGGYIVKVITKAISWAVQFIKE